MASKDSKFIGGDPPNTAMFTKYHAFFVPFKILEKYQINNMNSYSEIEKIWDAYKALLVDEAKKNAEEQVNKDREYVASGINMNNINLENSLSYRSG